MRAEYAAALTGYGCFPKAPFSFKSKMTALQFQKGKALTFTLLVTSGKMHSVSVCDFII